jgi:outer membrane lipoprotein-sorting protein
MKKLREKTGQSDLGSSPMDQTQALDYFNLTLKKEDKKSAVIEGKPKKPNKFIDKVEFVIDTERNLPVEVKIFNAKGSQISGSKLEYKRIKNIWVLSRNNAQVVSPQGNMEVEMDFSNIKINEGISDKEFKID